MRMTVSEGGALKAMNSKDDTEVRVSSVIWMFWLWITARPPPRREGRGLVMYLSFILYLCDDLCKHELSGGSVDLYMYNITCMYNV